MKSLCKHCFIIACLWVSLSGLAVSQVPQLINYQALLADPATGLPVADDTYEIVFSIYDTPTGGSAVWTETQNVQTQDGLYSVLLGSITPLTPAILSGPEKYLGIKVGADPEMVPRKRIVSVAYAIVSGNADSLGGKAATEYATKTDLSTSDGDPPNQGSNQVSWDNLQDVPAGFADGVDNTNGGGGGNTLDQAYDQGGPGTGRTITADAGPVNIEGPNGLTVSAWVGIGTSAPQHPLHVKGFFELEGSDFLMVDSSRGDGGRALVHWGSGSGTDDQMILNFAGDFEEGVTVDGSKLVVNGNFRLPATTATTGIIKSGADRFIHNFGGPTNFFAGVDAGNLTMSGDNNTGVGFKTFIGNTTGHSNTAMGRTALATNEIGHSNTAAGRSALFSNTSGSENTAFGRNALLTNDIGSSNTAIGYLADVGSGNLTNATAIGANAIVSSSNSIVLGGTGANAVNVGIGATSPASKLEVAGTIHSTIDGFKFPDGSVQTTAATGGGGLWSQSGSDIYYNTGNVGIGDTSPAHTLEVAGKIGINDTTVLYLPDQTDFKGSLFLGNGGGSLSNTQTIEGQRNTGVGIDALHSITSGWGNTATGYLALYSNTTGDGNTASGGWTLYSNTSGNGNTAIGEQALRNNTTGSGNLASGPGALYSNTTGSNNTASGNGALATNGWGDENTATGSAALESNTLGNHNTASGYRALYRNQTGNYNVGIGYEANRYNGQGSNNTIIGYQAGNGTSDHNKSGNVFIGYQAGYNETGDNKLYIENSNSSAPLIGGDFSTNRVGINTNSPGTAFAVVGLTGTSSFNYVKVNTATGDFYYATSSKRYKEDIQELEDDFSKILEVEPRSYMDKTSQQREIGYIAEEFDEKGLQDLVIYNENNQPNGIKYDRISLYLVEVVKKQQEQIAELQEQIKELQR